MVDQLANRSIDLCLLFCCISSFPTISESIGTSIWLSYAQHILLWKLWSTMLTEIHVFCIIHSIVFEYVKMYTDIITLIILLSTTAWIFAQQLNWSSIRVFTWTIHYRPRRRNDNHGDGKDLERVEMNSVSDTITASHFYSFILRFMTRVETWIIVLQNYTSFSACFTCKESSCPQVWPPVTYVPVDRWEPPTPPSTFNSPSLIIPTWQLSKRTRSATIALLSGGRKPFVWSQTYRKYAA